MDSNKEAHIRERAYEIWVREGRPHGKDAEHWQKAEAEIAAESGTGDRTAAGSKPRIDAPDATTVAPGASAAPPLRSRRAAPRSGANPPETTESAPSAGRRARKKPQP